MAVEHNDQPVNIELLDQQLRALGLPNYQGVSRMVKRRQPDGTVVPSAPYLLVQCDSLDATQHAQLTATITAHDPTQKTAAQTAAEQQAAVDQAELDQIALLAAKDPAALTLDEAKTLLVRLARRQLQRGLLG